MNILEKLFGTLAVFSQYAPSVDSNKSLRDLLPCARSAWKRMEGILSAGVLNSICTCGSDELKDYLRSAVANMTLSVQLVFDAVSRKKAEVDMYKYEIEAMQQGYKENFYNAMDSIIEYITTKIDEESPERAILSALQSTRYWRLLGSLPIQTCQEWDSIYPIDQSYLFFFRLIPLQKETIDERLSTYFSNEKLGESTAALDALRLALVKKTTAKALRRFDVMEFPPVIRNIYSDQVVNGTRKDERESLSSLAELLDQEAEQLIENIDMLLSTEDDLDISSRSAYNRPDDKIIMLP